VRLLLTEGQKSDHKGAATLLADLPSATEMLGDKGYDSDAYRAALVKRGIAPCIPPRAKRKNPATYCKALYKSATRSKTCSLNSKTGGASQCAMTAAPMFFYLQSRSPL
jgi:IS5 family transposase